MAKPKKYALDMFKTLAAIDRHDMSYYDRLSDDEKKGFHPLVIMRFVSSADGDVDDWNLLVTNDRANIHHYDLYDNPGLQYKLLATVGLGIKVKHNWIPTAASKPSKAKFDFLRSYYPEANDLELSIILKHLKKGDNLTTFLDGTGVSNDEIKRIKKIF